MNAAIVFRGKSRAHKPFPAIITFLLHFTISLLQISSRTTTATSIADACAGSSLSILGNWPIISLPLRVPVRNTLNLCVKIRKDRLCAIEDVVFALGLLVGDATRHLASTDENLILVE